MEKLTTEVALNVLIDWQTSTPANVRFIAYRRKPKVAIKTRKLSWRSWKNACPSWKMQVCCARWI